jgi:hypothetical protein
MTTSYGEIPGRFAALNTLSPGLNGFATQTWTCRFITLDEECVLMNTFQQSITPKAIQDLLDELEASKQSRLRAWKVLQSLRLVLSEAGNVTIPPPAQKTFDAEGEILEHALTKSFRLQNDAIKSLCSSVR